MSSVKKNAAIVVISVCLYAMGSLVRGAYGTVAGCGVVIALGVVLYFVAGRMAKKSGHR